MKNIAIFTHHDLDGVFSGFLLQKLLQSTSKNELYFKMIEGSAGNQGKGSINYKLLNQRIWFYDKVIIADFVPTVTNCQKLLDWQDAHREKALIFDHHKESYLLSKRFPQLQFVLPPKNDEYISASLLVANWLANKNKHLYDKYHKVAECISAYDTFAFSLLPNHPYQGIAEKLNMLFYYLGKEKFLARISKYPRMNYFTQEENRYFIQQNEQIKNDVEQIKLQHQNYKIIRRDKIITVWLVTYVPKYASEISNLLLTSDSNLDIIICSNNERAIFRTRSDILDMNTLAHMFAGGGHQKAAGAKTDWITISKYLKRESRR